MKLVEKTVSSFFTIKVLRILNALMKDRYILWDVRCNQQLIASVGITQVSSLF